MNAEAPSLPQCFRRIRLDLAREHDHPAGSAAFGYQLVAPLKADGYIDLDEWERHREACRVVRYRPTQPHEIGCLVRRPGGSWAFRYKALGDEAGYHFNDERFVPGEYVSVRDDGETHTFRVTSVLPV
jgi:hypothetical protein